MKSNKKIEKELNISILFLLLLILFFELGIPNLIYKSLFNTNGKFDNSILWNSISTLIGMLVFIGVMITIKSDSKLSKKNRYYENRKEILISEQISFEENAYKILNKIDPIHITEINDSTKDIINNQNNLMVVYILQNNRMRDFILLQRNVFYEFSGYFNDEELRKLKSYNLFIKNLSKYISFIEIKGNEYINNNQKEIDEIINPKSNDNPKDGDIKNSYSFINNDVIIEISNSRNNEWQDMLETLNQLIIERREYIYNMLDKI